MAAGPRHTEEIFNAAAEALVLVDPGDAESIADLVACVEALGDLFGADLDPEHPAVRCVVAVRLLESGDTGVLGELASAFDQARSLASSAAPGVPVQASAADAPEHARATDQPECAAPSAVMPLSGDEELIRDFAIRAVEHLDEADTRLLEMENHTVGPEGVDAVFRSFHTIKGMAGFLAFDDISDAAHSAENLLATARAEKVAPDAETVQALFLSVDRLRALVANAAPGVVTPGGTRSTDESEAAEVADAELPSGADQVRTGTIARETSVRIDERRLDVLLDTIGELVISESMISSAIRTGDIDGLDGRLERLDKITRELQQMATSLRMVPMRSTFRRMARLVRDLAHKAGKPVELVLVGEDIELDKTVVDRIQDPLVHALRNAVDHGIELPAERRAAGKPETGRIVMSAYHSGGSIHIDVSDDGRGVSREGVLKRAIASGLIAEDASPAEEELLELIFAPGFSTARTITDVSGRGVGMDVVRRTVEELRGHVDLASQPGAGMTLSIRLPVTLAIIDGMVCRVGEERYVVPVLSIERSVRPNEDQVHSVHGRGLMMDTEDGLVPVVALHDLLGVDGAETDPTRGVVVIVDEAGRRAGLLTCELLGQQQTVIKPLGEGLDNQLGLAGGAIMSDGRVGLILDAAGIVRLAHRREREWN